jgi:tripeptide aminopeptidase
VSVAAGGVVDLFCDLAAIPSPSRREREVADRVLTHLRGLGLDADEDEAGARTGSDIGNIYCRLPATDPGGVPIFLNAHLDTVPPDGPVEPEVRNGVITNRRDTILGADNKAAVAVMLEAVARLARGTPHGGVELVLTPMEEVGLRGAKAFDTSRLHADLGYCYDHAAPIGNVVLAAPTQKTLELRFLGRAAHSGIAPEEGRSAIAAAARAVADMQLGRIDAATTANVGLISGGIAGNIVPPECTVRAEARSRDPDRLREQVQSMLDAATYAANLAECELESRIISEYEGYRLGRSHEAVRLVSEALREAGYEVTYIESGGGADANVFNAAGVPCVNVCNGMAEIHTASEHISIADLEGMLAVTLRLIEVARTSGSRIAQPDQDGGTA